MVETIPFETASYPTLTYAKSPFPAVVLDGKPWWSTAHVQHALNSGYAPKQCDVFTELHVGAHRFPFDAEDEQSHVISTLAAHELAARHLDRRANRMLDGWLRKRELELRTAPPECPGTLFAVREGGPKPERSLYGGPVAAEWKLWDEAHRARFPRPALVTFAKAQPVPAVRQAPNPPPAPPTDPEELRLWGLRLIGRG